MSAVARLRRPLRRVVGAVLLLALWPGTIPFAWGDGLSYGRIVSLSPQVTESVYLLGQEAHLVGVTTFCRRPTQASMKQQIGSPLRPDVEAIMGLNPDLVIASREGNPPWAVARLKHLGVPVAYLGRPTGYDGLAENFLEIARLTGALALGEKIVAEVRAGLGTGIRRRTAGIVWQVGANPLIVASSASFANDIIRHAGATNIIAMEIPYPRMNVEEVLARKPDLIVLTDHGYSVEAEMRKWRSYLPGVRFVRMDPYVIAGPNPVTFLEAVRQLEKTLDE
jgi:iron complex transport system substrate-binding protein